MTLKNGVHGPAIDPELLTQSVNRRPDAVAVFIFPQNSTWSRMICIASSAACSSLPFEAIKVHALSFLLYATRTSDFIITFRSGKRPTYFCDSSIVTRSSERVSFMANKGSDKKTTDPRSGKKCRAFSRCSARCPDCGRGSCMAGEEKHTGPHICRQCGYMWS